MKEHGRDTEASRSSCVLFYLGSSAEALERWWSLTWTLGSLLGVFGNVDRKLLQAEATKMSKGKEARNLRYVSNFLLSFAPGRRRRQRKWQHEKQKDCGCGRGHDKRAGSMESKLCLLSHFAKGQLRLRIWRENWDYLCSTMSNTSEAKRSWELLS